MPPRQCPGADPAAQRRQRLHPLDGGPDPGGEWSGCPGRGSGPDREVEGQGTISRIWAAIALGDIGREVRAAVPALTEASKNDEFDQVRWLAAVALVKIASDKAVVPLLVAALKGPQIDDYFQVRQYATEALGRLGPGAKAAVPALGAALKDKHPGIRSAAAAALAQIGPEAQAAIPLREGLKDKDESARKAAAEALKKIQQK